jgi:hypothetical protein
MEEMELLVPRAKKDVWERRRVVRVTAVGERSMRASEVRWVVLWGGEDLQRKKNCSRKSRYSGMLGALVCVRRKRVAKSKRATARSDFR